MCGSPKSTLHRTIATLLYARPVRTQATQWKANYHTARAMMGVAAMLRELEAVHDPERRAETECANPAVEPAQIVARERLYVRVHNCRARPLELLDLGQHRRRRRHGNLRHELGEQPGSLELIGRVRVRVEEDDRE